MSWAEPHTRGLPSLRIERHDRQRRLARASRLAKVRDRGTDDGRFYDVIPAPFLDRALMLADPDDHLLQHHAVCSVLRDVAL
jgi:hypothetical protein